MRIIKGNLLHITSGIIVHQVNNKKHGAGLALQIRQRYPKHYNDYMKAKMILGRIVISCVSPELTVVDNRSQVMVETDVIRIMMLLRRIQENCSNP